jgi:hypothetical protein
MWHGKSRHTLLRLVDFAGQAMTAYSKRKTCSHGALTPCTKTHERNIMKKQTACCTCLLLLAGIFCPAPAAEMVIVENGANPVPIVIAPEALPENVLAANCLAEYIEKISGAHPAVITNAPDQVPAKAIWIGIQPAVSNLFPKVYLDFPHPEEILIACDGRNLLVAGRDKLAGASQVEYGTANAVYTFLQKYLDVRWLWPGPTGEDVVSNKTISLPPFEYRFHPPFRQREMLNSPRYGQEVFTWSRRQRTLLDSSAMSAGHAFNDWWDKYHEAHPDYFALQPDGTRSAYPSTYDVKLCESNPKVWEQWLQNAEEALRAKPTMTVINAAPNDGSNAGICTCEKCRTWDHPEGRLCMLNWKGLSKEYPAMTDRYITFWNHLAGMLKEKFPDRGLYVSGFAYGPAMSPPVKATPADNIIIGYVGHFPSASNERRSLEKEAFGQWAEKAPHLVFRPNVFYYSGGHHGLPTLALSNTVEDMRFLAANKCIGVIFDGIVTHWAPIGIQNYFLAQCIWDPNQDLQALLDDYCRRGFGAAADEMKQYFNLMESAHMAILARPDWFAGMRSTRDFMSRAAPEAFNTGLLDRAKALLDKADEKLKDKPEIYRKRVEFVRAGLDFARLQTGILSAMNAVRASQGKDAEAVNKALELCKARDLFFKQTAALAVNGNTINTTWIKGRELEDFLGPPARKFLESAGIFKQYRWTGKAGTADWSLAGNWEVKSGKVWAAAASCPQEGDYVRLEDHAGTNAAESIFLDREVRIGRLIMEAAGRDYAICNRAQDPKDNLDAYSGMLYTLYLSDPCPLEQTATAAGRLSLQVPLQLLTNDVATAQIGGTNAAAVVLERPLKAAKGLAVKGAGPETKGMLELRESASTPVLAVYDGGNLLLNYSGGHANPSIRVNTGTVLVRRDAALGEALLFNGTLAFRIHGAGTNDINVTMGSITRAGRINLQAPEDGSRGCLRFRVADICSSAGNISATSFHLDRQTLLLLDGDQQLPMRQDLAAGIHGAGSLVKDLPDKPVPRARKVSIIGDRNTYTGGTYILKGAMQLAVTNIPADNLPRASNVDFAGCLGPGPLYIATGGVFDLNGLDQAVSGLGGIDGRGGEVRLSGGRLTIASITDSEFGGTIAGPGTFIKTGPGIFTLPRGYASTSNLLLRAEGGLLRFPETLAIKEGSLELAGGRVEADMLESGGQTWKIILAAGDENQALVKVKTADLTKSALRISLANNYKPKPGTVFTLISATDAIKGASEESAFGYAGTSTLTAGEVSFKIIMAEKNGLKSILLEAL